MSNILQWEPVKSPLWSNAKIQNIDRLREDLRTLSDWVKTKAEAAVLSTKADTKKVVELEEAIGGTRMMLETFRRDVERALQEIGQEIEQLDKWAKSGEAEKRLQAVAETQLKAIDELCTEQHESLEQLLNSTREAQESARQAAAETRVAANQTKVDAAETKAAAEKAGAAQAACTDMVQSLEKNATELSRAWEEVRRTLTRLTGNAEQAASQTADLHQATQQTLSECQAAAREGNSLRASLQSEFADVSGRMTSLLRETDAQAIAVRDQAEHAAAILQTAERVRTECETLAQALQSKAEELSAQWESLHTRITTASGTAQQNAGQVDESARQARECLEWHQADLQASQALQVAIQSQLEESTRRLDALGTMVEQARDQLTASGERLGASEQLHTEMVRTEAQLKALIRATEVHATATKEARDDADLMRKEVQQRLTSFQLNSVTFWRRIRWLLLGPR